MRIAAIQIHVTVFIMFVPLACLLAVNLFDHVLVTSLLDMKFPGSRDSERANGIEVQSRAKLRLTIDLTILVLLSALCAVAVATGAVAITAR